MNDGAEILKLEPAHVIKPWGLVHGEVMRHTSISAGLGELWLASAQTGPGPDAAASGPSSRGGGGLPVWPGAEAGCGDQPGACRSLTRPPGSAGIAPDQGLDAAPVAGHAGWSLRRSTLRRRGRERQWTGRRPADQNSYQ